MKLNLSNLDTIQQGTSQVLPLDDLKKKLSLNRPLIVKLGADPTSPNLHLGHAVVLEKLRDLQLLGHTIKFLIGDFTARIGDPSGKNKTRPPLSEEEISKNVTTYIAQIGKILDMKKTEVVYNADWFDPLSSRDWLRIASRVTIARILEREDFKKRYEGETPIYFHELLYPILQGYDSVVLKADIEVGGTDQTFNLLMGRYLQEEMGMEPQVIITMPLLVGLDGVQKMSKSLHNEIGLLDEPRDVYGKIMSISDKAMWEYYAILLRYDKTVIEDMQKNMHPMEAKKQLAREIIARYWGAKEAEDANITFEQTFQKRNYDHVQEFFIHNETYAIIDLMLLINPSWSKSEARRLIGAGAVSINDVKIDSLSFIYQYDPRNNFIRIGKHIIYRLVLAK